MSTSIARQDIATELARRRQAVGFSRPQLAQAAGVAWIWEIENGLLCPRPKTIAKLFDALEKEADLKNVTLELLPEDAEQIRSLGRSFDGRISDSTIENWFNWDPHPALGRKIRGGKGGYVINQKNGQHRQRRCLLVSRADIEACLEAWKNPLFREFPGNPGFWIAEGIFQHDDKRLFFTAKYIADHYKFSAPGYSNRHIKEPLKVFYQLEKLEVIFPRRGSKGRWRTIVYAQSSVEAIAQRRKGESGANGKWLVANRVWNDLEGVWHSSEYLAISTGLTPKEIWRLRELGAFSRLKTIPRNKGERGRPVVVHHSTEALPFLMIAPGCTSAREVLAKQPGRTFSLPSTREPTPTEALFSPPANDQAPESAPRIIIGQFGDPVIVNGQRKPLISISVFKVVKALVEAGEGRMLKDSLEDVNSDARRILKKLAADDSDWANVIHFPTKKGEGYGIF